VNLRVRNFYKMNFNLDLNIVLENEVVLLRPLELSDVENLMGVAVAHPDLVRYSPTQIHSRALLTDYVENALAERMGAGTRYAFVIFDKVKNAYAGSTSFLNISQANGNVEIGWTWIGPEFQRSGLNRNCKFLLLSYAFEVLGAERVELKTDERNLQSRTAILKLGAKYEGILRSNTLMSDGFRRNTVYYSILRDEWAGVKLGFGIV
jgi:N-acetyltransferase